MKNPIPYFILLFVIFCLSTKVLADDAEINPKVIIQENDDLKPMQPYINECCAKVDLDLVPSTDRKSGHLNTHTHKIISIVPKDENRLKEGSRIKGYDIVDKSGSSKARSNQPELKLDGKVPRYNQTELIAENDEEKVVQMLPRSEKVFIRNLRTLEDPRIPTAQRVNGEGKYGVQLGMQIPKDEKPLKNGSLEKGYDWIASQNYYGELFNISNLAFEAVPREYFMSNRILLEVPVQAVPADKNGFLDCR